jgi:hypothetical protein
MLYGERNIDNKCFVDWVKEWDEKVYLDFWRNLLVKNPADLKDFPEADFVKEIQNLKNLCVNLEKTNDIEDCYYKLLPVLNDAMFQCYFRCGNSSIKVANFYEMLLLPADIITHKSLICGFDLEERFYGNIDLYDNDIVIGNIGQMSDLYWHVFYYQYILENENGGINHAHDHSNYLTLQIWDKLPEDNLDFYIEGILYNCSTKLGLNFKKVEFNELQLTRGEINEYRIDLNTKSLEYPPLLYFNSAAYNPVPRLKFLAFYQVIEYFYIRANNILLQKSLIEANISDKDGVDFKKVHAAINSFKSYSSEKQALKLVLQEALDIEKFKNWLDKDYRLLNYYTKINNECPNLKPINFNDNKSCISSIGERVYSTRCSIVHSKGDIEEFLFTPGLNDTLLDKEIPLIKTLAIIVLEKWSS